MRLFACGPVDVRSPARKQGSAEPVRAAAHGGRRTAHAAPQPLCPARCAQYSHMHVKGRAGSLTHRSGVAVHGAQASYRTALPGGW